MLILLNSNDLLSVMNLFLGQVLEQAVVEGRTVEDGSRIASTNTEYRVSLGCQVSESTRPRVV